MWYGLLATAAATKRKTSLTLDAQVLESAKASEINVSAVAQAALENAEANARHLQWLNGNAKAFAVQTAWHEHHGHPLAEIV